MIRARWIVVLIADRGRRRQLRGDAAAPRALLPASPAAARAGAWRDSRPHATLGRHRHGRRRRRAAARAGLNFVILTDHGDGTREPDAPAYRHGVLCIDAVEISTDERSRRRARSAARAVSARRRNARRPRGHRRLGGMAIAAHPASPKPQLRWTDWSVPIDGLEWLNGDSEWRDEPLRALRAHAADVSVPATGDAGHAARSSAGVAATLGRADRASGRWLAWRAPTRTRGFR